MIEKDMIGLSLSLCIRDIIEKRVSYHRVKFIISGTYIKTREDLDKVIETYNRLYWKKNQLGAEFLARELFSNHQIIQPRLDEITVNIALGHWYKLTTI